MLLTINQQAYSIHSLNLKLDTFVFHMANFGMLRMLTSTVLLVYLISLSQSQVSKPLSSFPFNLPDHAYCQSCVLGESENLYVSAQPTNEMDRYCRDYVVGLHQKHSPFSHLYQFLDKMMTLPNTTNSFIFYWAFAAKTTYELLFDEAYSYRILVEPEPENYDNCITAYVEGKGFINTQQSYTNLTTVQRKLFEEGLEFERLYIDTVIYIWAVKTCNATTNFHFVQNASLNLERARMMAKNLKLFRIYTPVVPKEVFYSNSSLPTCGNLSPKPPIGEPSVIPGSCDDVICDSSAKRARTSDPPNVPPVDPPCPSGQVDTGKGTCIPEGDGVPRLYINEIFSCRPDDPNRREFLELRSYPFTSVALIRNHKVVAFTVYTQKLLLVINIYNRFTTTSGLLLFNDNSDLSVYTPKDRSMYNNFQILPCSTSEPVVLLLLKQTSGFLMGWDDIKLVGQRNKPSGLSPKSLLYEVRGKKTDLLAVFKQTVIDGVIYGIPINTAVPQAIKDLVAVPTINCNFIIPISNSAIRNDVTLSLNSCPASVPKSFDREHFKLGVPTPGTQNDCSMTIGFQLQDIEQPRSLMNEVGVTRAANDFLDCPSEEEKLHPKIAELDAMINYEIRYIREKLDPSYVCKFYPLKKFKTEVWPQLLYTKFTPDHPNFPDDISPFEKVPSNQGNTIPQINQHWRCEICHKRLLSCPHSFHSGATRDDFITSAGRSIPTQTKSVQEYLMRHVNRRTHYTSILYQVREDRRRLAADQREKYKTPPQEGLEKLANVFLVTFTLVKTNTAISGSTIWYKTLRKIDANIGTGVMLHGEKAAANIITFISLEGFSNIKNYLVQKEYPFTLILDGASDRMHHHYLSVFIQSLEGEETIAFFMALIPGGKSATAADILQDIKNWLGRQSPAFQEYFKRRIVGCSSDGAAVMRLFQRLLNDWIAEETSAEMPSRTLMQTYCLAHKLNLASRSALIPLKSDIDHGKDRCLEYFQSIEKFMQSTYTWISLAQRRMGEYREVAIEFRQPKIELKELHVQRWISSEHTTIKYFLKGWITSIETMKRIKNDTSNYKKSVRDDAESFLHKLQDKQKLITIIFLQDYTAAFKTWSVMLQRFVGLMSDQFDNFNDLKNELEQIKSLNGGVLTGFLRSCTCFGPGRAGLPCTSVEDYETSSQVSWSGYTFFSKDTEAPSLQILGPELIRKSVERLDFYVSHDLLENLSVFSPKKFPAGKLVLEKAMQTEDFENSGYGVAAVQSLAPQFGLSSTILVPQWKDLLKSIMVSKSWDIDRSNRDTDEFWSTSLRDETLAWKTEIRFFIQCIKTITVGSSMVESSFSIFNVIKNQRRSKISDKHLESIMNLLINGPSSVDNFNEFEYAMSWKNAGRRLVEDKECEGQIDDDDIQDDPIGLNEIDDDLVITDDIQSVDEDYYFDIDDNDDHSVDFDIDPDEQDRYDELKRTSRWKYEKINRIRTLLM